MSQLRSAIILCCLLLTLPVAAQQKDQTHNILVFHSYHAEFQWTGEIMKGIHEELAASFLETELVVEYLDYKRFPDYPEERHRDRLEWKYGGNPPDLIILSDNGALDLVLKFRESLFPGVPVVFCGINGEIAPILGDARNITGIVERWDPEHTLDLIKSLQPQIKRILLFYDRTPSGLGTLSDFNRIKEPFLSTFTFSDLPDQSFDESMAHVKSLGTDTAVLLLGYNRDSEGRIFDSGEIARYLAEVSDVPVYTMDETRFVQGILGGSLLSGKKQGAAAARMGLEILMGKKADDIPVIEDPQPNQVVDYQALSRFEIPPNRIPGGTEVINQPETFYYRYKTLIWATAVVFFLLGGLSIGLLVNHFQRMRAEQENKRLAAILEATSDIVSYSGLDQTILYINSAGKKLFDFNPEGRQIREIHPEGFFKFLSTEILDILEKEGIWKGDNKLITKGGPIPVSQVILLHRDKMGRKQYISTIMRDISELKANEERIRKSEENLSITLDSIGDAVISCDENGRIISINPAGEALIGWPREEAVGKPVQQILKLKSAATEKPVENPVDRVLASGDSFSFGEIGIVLIDGKGQHKHVSDSAAPIRNRNGKITGVVLVFRDITEELHLQEQLDQSQRMEVIGQLAGGIAHDFNNLLTGIMGTAELLTLSLPPEGEDHLLAKDILSASEKAGELTSHLLTFSRKGHMRSVPVHFHTIVEEVVRLLSRSIDKQIEIQQNLEAQEDLVSGDPVALQAAVLNLAVNSRDAVELKGKISFHTQIVSIDEPEGIMGEIAPGRYLYFSVEDNGKGMSKEVQSKIFEPYYTTKPVGKGTGLGLAAVYGCMKTHHGHIQVKSEEGVGTVFHLYLPLLNNVPSENQVKNVQIIQKGSSRILLIDDEEIIRNISARMLQNLGYQVEVFPDGLSGADYFRNHRDEVNLIILDLIMPKIDGSETFQLLKDIDPAVPVLLSSGFVTHHKINLLLEAGAAGFINKPFSLEVLSAKLKEILSE